MSLWDPRNEQEAFQSMQAVMCKMMLASPKQAAKLKRKISGAIGNMNKKAKKTSSKSQKTRYKRMAHMFKRMKKRLR